MMKALLTISLGTALALPALANTGKDKPESSAVTNRADTKSARKGAPQADADAGVPQGFVLIEDYVTMDLKQLPIDLLQAAQTDFSNRNLGETAADLRAAARVFRLEAKQSDSGDKHLQNAADDLDKLAGNVKSESVKAPDVFHAELARALYHDAAHHRLQAQREWDKREYHRAGDDLRASAVAADLAGQWGGKDVYADNKANVRKARDVASRLTRNEGWTRGDVADALDRMQTVVGSLAGRLMPSSDRSRAGETPSGL
jgi:hypothetical protein